MEWYYIVLIAILVFFIVLAVIVYFFRERLFNWVVATILGLYIASPLDLLPDFIPIAGWADDIAAFIMMIGFIYRGIKMINKNKVKSRSKSVSYG
jgi:uncharacterized membrane protein YkvA (DUF1232 family)